VAFDGGGTHEVRLPARAFPDGASATCGDDDIDVTPMRDCAKAARTLVVRAR
jgi:hypothetical protein